MEKKLIAENCFESELRFPVFCHYDGQFEPQPAFIFLDIETGEVNANYNSCIGNATTLRVWHNKELHFPINPHTFVKDVEELILDNMNNFQTILDGSSVVWDGNNYVGQFNDEAQKIIEKLIHEESLYDYVDVVMFENINDFADVLWFSNDTQTLTELATDIYETGNDAGYWSDDLDSVESIENEILEYWLNCLYSGHDIPKREAKLLITDSRVDISSKWLTEINEFAD